VARIRTLKPEFWSSPGIRGLEFGARLLFQAMWNWADDYGRGSANPGELLGFAFPWDDELTTTDIRRMLGAIGRAFGVIFYEVDGRPYYAIPTWNKHQKIDKRSNRRHPGPEQGNPWEPEAPGSSDTRPQATSHEASRSSAPEHSAESRGQKPMQDTGTSPGKRRDDGADTIVGEWVGRCRKRPPRNVIGMVGKHIKVLLGEGVDPADVRAGLLCWERKGLHPSTLPSVVNEVMNAQAGNVVALRGGPSTRSTKDTRVEATLALAAELEERSHPDDTG